MVLKEIENFALDWRWMTSHPPLNLLGSEHFYVGGIFDQ